MAWVNGHMIGRYWDIKAGGGCSTCDYRGTFDPLKCLTGTLAFQTCQVCVSERALIHFENILFVSSRLRLAFAESVPRAGGLAALRRQPGCAV
jgi:hypothetical protein